MEQMLKHETSIALNQFSFIFGRSIIEKNLYFKTINGKYRDTKQYSHILFINLEKTYNKVPRKVPWWI